MAPKKSRVNIVLEVDKEGAKETIKLPFVLMMLGDYKGRKDEEENLQDREPVDINEDNFDERLAEMDVRLEGLSVEDHLSSREKMTVDLSFKTMDDFRPEKVAEKIGDVNKVLAMRHLLNDLRSRLVNERDFKERLGQLVSNEGGLEEAASLLDSLVTWEKPADAPEDVQAPADDA